MVRDRDLFLTYFARNVYLSALLNLRPLRSANQLTGCFL
jgi:hypothetical protein